MSKNRISLFVAALLVPVTVFISCKKDDNSAPAGNDPVIELTSPADGQQFHNGDTIWILGNISAKDEIHEYSVEIADGGTTYYSYDKHVDNKTLPLNLFWKVNVPAQANARFKIEVSDHNGRHTELKRDLLLKP